MPSRAPTYYHWSMDKPSTTNQIYGYELKSSMVEVPPRKTPGPFDYTRPFSNTAFFPQISATSSHVNPGNIARLKCSSAGDKTRQSAPPSGQWCPLSPVGASFNMNRGYSVGHVPVSSRVVRTSVPSGMRLDRSKSAPQRTFQYRKPKADELFLWHTLSGSLVHVENHPPCKEH